MSTRSPSLFQTILARISFGAVPVDGHYWFDPKNATRPKSRQEPADVDADWSPVSLSVTRRLQPTQRKSS
jgi:hypothetical protein